jgi:hypothetical protein
MPEITMNLHMHTTYSDGTGSHQELAQAALETGIDVIAVTDHNVLVQGPEGYYREGGRRVLMLIGEEIHDRSRVPQKNHLLVLGADQELADLAEDPQVLINAAAEHGAVTFLAHPTDPAAPEFGQSDISWVNWDVEGFTGLELWNGFSEFKRYLTGKLKAIYYAYQPDRIARGPFPETVSRWDQLTASGRKVVAVGGSDAHALDTSLGPLRRTLFPYQFHFKAVNTHLILPDPLSGNYQEDRQAVVTALRQGHAFIGYDLPASTAGFRFHAAGKYQQAIMGDEISSENGVTLQVRLPERAECRLIKDGLEIKRWNNRTVCSHTTTEAGVYRVEAYRQFKGQLRTWILSNPIYIRKPRD